MGFKVLWWMVDWMKQWARESLLSTRFPFCSLCWRSQAFEPFQSQQNQLGNTVPLRDSSPQLFGLAVLALVGVDPEAPSGSSLLLPTQKYIVIIAIIIISFLSLFLTFQTPGLLGPTMVKFRSPKRGPLTISQLRWPRGPLIASQLRWPRGPLTVSQLRWPRGPLSVSQLRWPRGPLTISQLRSSRCLDTLKHEWPKRRVSIPSRSVSMIV